MLSACQVATLCARSHYLQACAVQCNCSHLHAAPVQGCHLDRTCRQDINQAGHTSDGCCQLVDNARFTLHTPHSTLHALDTQFIIILHSDNPKRELGPEFQSCCCKCISIIYSYRVAAHSARVGKWGKWEMGKISCTICVRRVMCDDCTAIWGCLDAIPPWPGCLTSR